MRTTGELVLAHLTGFDLKPEGQGQWRCNSPLRPGANSHSFTLRIDSDGEHGAFDDKAGGESGSLYTLAQRLGIELPKSERPQVEDSKRAYKNLAEYAALKGIPEAEFIKAKWATEPAPTRCPRTHLDRPALEFPTQGGKRYRFMDGEKPPFKSEHGYKACWYGIAAATGIAKSNEWPLIICNGEPSVIAGLYHRLPACAITGGEQPTIPATLLEELKSKWSGSIILAMDCDETGIKSANGKAAILRGAGYVVHVIDLGLGDKGDLADFCKLYTTDAMARLLTLLKPTKDKPKPTPELPQLLQELTNARKENNPQAIETLPVLLDKIQTEIDKSRLQAQPEAVQSFAHLVSVRHKRLDAARKNPDPVQGLRSGMHKIDDMIGGFVAGRVYTLYGDTGMGKSTMSASIVSHFAGQAPGFIIPTESMPGDYLDKLVAYKAGITYDLIETGQLDNHQYNTVMAAYGWLEERKCHILDSLSPTSTTVGSAIRSGIAEFGYQWVLIDSINNLTSLIHDDIYGKTSEAADFAQSLARMGLVVLITSQIGRNLKGRGENKIPRLTDALGSGKVEQNSDVVMALYNHQYYVDREEALPNPAFPMGKALVRCLKHRWRGSAVNRATFLTFKGGIGHYD